MMYVVYIGIDGVNIEESNVSNLTNEILAQSQIYWHIK